MRMGVLCALCCVGALYRSGRPGLDRAGRSVGRSLAPCGAESESKASRRIMQSMGCRAALRDARFERPHSQKNQETNTMNTIFKPTRRRFGLAAGAALLARSE